MKNSHTVPEVHIVSRLGTREYNEDRVATFTASDKSTICILADGLGGHGGGALAAQIVVDSLVESVNERSVDRDDLTKYLAIANDKIKQTQAVSEGLSQMRTTVVLLHLDATTAFWMHCGDSRLYHLRAGEIMSVTLDHSVAQMLVSDGELTRNEIPDHMDKNKLTRSLGGGRNESNPRVLKQDVQIQNGDRFLLCSDGWWERMNEDVLKQTSSESPIARWLDDIEGSFVSSPDIDYDNFSAIAVGI